MATDAGNVISGMMLPAAKKPTSVVAQQDPLDLVKRSEAPQSDGQQASSGAGPTEIYRSSDAAATGPGIKPQWTTQSGDLSADTTQQIDPGGVATQEGGGIIDDSENNGSNPDAPKPADGTTNVSNATSTPWNDAPPATGATATTPAQIPTLPAQTRTADMQALVDQLKARASQSTVIDPNDPVLKAQTDAYRAEQIRAARNATADAAEQNSPYNTGQQAGIARMMNEKVGQNTSQFEANLMQQELTSRRNEIQQALDSMGGLLSDEEKNGLQRELANLNAAVSQAQMNTQNTQFYAGLSQQDKQFVSQLAQNEKFHNSDDAFKRMQLAQDQSQFVAKLAQDGKIADMQNALENSKLAQSDKEFIMKLAQDGKYADIEAAYKTAALSQDQNQFVAKLAQEGKMADMDDLFRRMQLAQQQTQFLDRLGFDSTQQQAYWDWIQRTGGTPSPGN
jgi:hypothetical protein